MLFSGGLKEALPPFLSASDSHLDISICYSYMYDPRISVSSLSVSIYGKRVDKQ